MNYLILALGGAIGTILRFGAGQLVYRDLNTPVFPWSTLIVNLAGCSLIGFLYAYFEHGSISNGWRLFLFTGLLGGFTTFSAYSLETINLFRRSEYLMGLINITANNLGGLLLAFLAYLVGRMMINS